MKLSDTTRRWFSLGLLLICASMVFSGVSGAEDSSEMAGGDSDTEQNEVRKLPDFSGKVAIIPIKGAIINESPAMRLLLGGEDAVAHETVIKLLEKAESDGAKMIVLEIDSPGGIVDSCEKICQKLIEIPENIPTVALVTGRAISGGSMVATACREIVMKKGTTIGDCEPHAMNMELPDYMREKIETTIRARMRANAQANGYPEKLLEAMVTKKYKLFEVTFDKGVRDLMFENELELLDTQIENGESERKITDRKIVADAGELLTLTESEAKEAGLSKNTVTTVDEFYSGREIAESDKVEGLASLAPFQFKRLNITLLMILGACLIIGIAGVVVESQVPGFGLPGVVGIIGFASFFSILFLHGRAEPFEIALFVLGLGLLMAEIFLIPGFGVAGILGICCLLASLMLSFMPPLTSNMDWKNESITFVNLLGLSGFAAILLGGAFIKIAPSLPIVGGLFLTRGLRSGKDILSDVAQLEEGEFPREEKQKGRSLVGVEGITITTLRPAGKMKADNGDILDVVSNGVIIEKDARVRVTDHNGPRIEVNKI